LEEIMIRRPKNVLFACFVLFAAGCGSQGSDSSSSDSAVEAEVGEQLAPTSFRAAPATELRAIGRPVVSARAELRKVLTHDADVTELGSQTRSLPLDADTQEGSISLSASK
jgi:hypothetical protein